MSYKWDTGYVENLDIVDGRQFDNIINNYASVVNGGLDRENLPAGCVNSDMIQSKSIAIASVNRLNYEKTTTANPIPSYWTTFGWTPRGNQLAGITYNSMQGGDVNVLAAVTNVDCEEGMLTVMWKCMQWVNSHFIGNIAVGGGAAANTQQWKGAYWLVKVDGNIVAQSRTLYANFSNVNIETAIPISKGNHEVRIEFNFLNAKDGDFNTYYDFPVFHWWGGTIFTLNRLR